MSSYSSHRNATTPGLAPATEQELLKASQADLCDVIPACLKELELYYCRSDVISRLWAFLPSVQSQHYLLHHITVQGIYEDISAEEPVVSNWPEVTGGVATPWADFETVGVQFKAQLCCGDHEPLEYIDDSETAEQVRSLVGRWALWGKGGLGCSGHTCCGVKLAENVLCS